MPTETRRPVIVVGAGLGGLTVAAYLARGGQPVLVCEQASSVGGCFASFSHDGFTFDVGLKAVEDSGMLRPMLRQLGLLERVALRPSQTGLALPDRFVPLRRPSDVDLLFVALAERYPDQREGLTAVLGEARRAGRYVDTLVSLPNPIFVERRDLAIALPGWAFRHLPDLVRAREAKALLRVSLIDLLERHLSRPEPVRFLSQLFFKGTPALFGLGYSRQFLDYHYPTGGLRQIPEALAELVGATGGEVRTSVAVRRILTVGGRATGVELATGERLESDYVVVAGDARRAFLELLEPEALSSEYRERVARTPVGESAVCALLAVDVKPEDLPIQGCAHFYVLPDWQGIDVENRSAPDHFAHSPVEVSVPCLLDPSLAPAGMSGIIVSAIAEHDYGLDWPTESADGDEPRG